LMVVLGERTPTRCQWCMSLPHCVYGDTACTAESSRAFGGNAPVLCSTVVDAARNGGSGSQAHSHVGGGVTSKLLCTLDPNHTDASLLTLCATHLPAGTLRGSWWNSWWKLAVRVPPMNVWPTCVSTAHLHQPHLQPTCAGWQSTLRCLVRPPSHPRTDPNTRIDNTQPPLTPLPRLPPLRPIKGYLGPSQPRRDHAPRSQVTRDSPSNPAHHARPLVSALPPRRIGRFSSPVRN
jgi:hypothetical protein